MLRVPAKRARRPPVVFVFNSSSDMIELLRILFERHGLVVLTGHVADVRRGTIDLKSLVEQHKPDVILYDLIPPYDRQWQFLDHLRQTSPLRGIPFVISTTNAPAARKLAGRDEDVHEVLGRPFDMEALVVAVKQAVKRRRPS
jgi:Response regulator containing CheY-like receiver, AAA-type ATPase, and DNA-binding domains